MNNVTKDIINIGVNDHDVDLFEGQYVVELGMAYNSYVILDEKVAVLDTVDAHFTEEWLGNLKEALGGRKPDYVVVHHMEPDHAGSLDTFMKEYPEAVVVSSAKAFVMMQQFFGNDYADRREVIKEGSVLELGKHSLSFVAAPMVHWPEVMMSYDAADKVLFSADAFGKFGANDVEDPEGWSCEARRYYFGIVGKYGAQAQAVLKKAASLDIAIICPVHGPVLNENLGYYLDLYQKWSTYTPENEGVTIAYASVYGNTKKAVENLAVMLKDKGIKVAVHDLARMDVPEAIEDAFRYDRLVLATPTYNGDVFPPVKAYIEGLTERNYQNRKIGIIENGSWAPTAARVIKKLFEGSKNLTFCESTVTIKSALNAESEAALKALAEELA